MALVPPIPQLPQLPYPLPYGIEVDRSHILGPPADDFCARCVKEFLDHLIREPCRREGCDWIIVANRKMYLVRWRDVAPRTPWTRQVWDIYRVLPDNCGSPTTPVSLGWQWCWRDVICTISADVFGRWQEGNISGSGMTVVAIGTNALQPATPGIFQQGPVVYLDAADPDTLVLEGGGVSRWVDKSTQVNDAVQVSLANRPTIEPASLNGLDTLRFDEVSQQFMTMDLKALDDWHLFVVGRFFLTGAGNTRGTFFSASGLENTFGGADAQVYQDSSVQPAGTPLSFVNPSELPMIGTTVPEGTFGVWEWSERISESGSVTVGVNAFEQQVFTGDTSDDFWDPTRQTFGEPVPVPAALGRANWGLNPARTFDYLNGNVGQVLLYPRVLAHGERVQILNVLREKWGLGAPLPFPPSP